MPETTLSARKNRHPGDHRTRSPHATALDDQRRVAAHVRILRRSTPLACVRCATSCRATSTPSSLDAVRHGKKLDVDIAPRVAQAIKEWALGRGATHFTHWFQPQTGLTAEKHDAFLSFDDGQPMEAFGGVAAHSERARRVELPVGRPARDLGSARLHGVEPGEPGVHRRVGGREDAVHPVGVHRLQRRSARRDDAAAPQLRRALGRRRSSCSSCSATSGVYRVVHDARPRAGVLPHRPRALRAASRPRDGRPHAHRRAAAARPAARGSLLRRHPGAHPGVHRRSRARAVQARRPDHDAAQRSRAEPVRDGADLRRDERRDRPQPARHGDAAPRRAAPRPRRRCCTRSRSPASTASGKHCNWSMSIAADNPTSTATTCSSRARRRTRTCASSSSSPRCSRAVHKHAGLLRAGIGTSRQRAPPRRERSAAGDHLGLHGRRCSRSVIDDDRAAARAPTSAEQRDDQARRREAAGDREGQHRPQPHVAVRVHRQQVRVPRGRLVAVDRVPDRAAQRGGRRGDR